MSFIQELLGSGGRLSQVREDYEYRPSQVLLAEAVERVVARGGVLLAEAGTGTGKTLAYLAGVLDARQRVVVSTGTKNLQDQLMDQDLPLLEAALGQKVAAVVLKGLSNYLCLRKLEMVRGNLPFLGTAEAHQVSTVTQWAEKTTTGDRAELAELAEDAALWVDVCATSATRLGPRCPFFERCFVTRAREAALQAQIVIVNHHLYFADRALRSSGTGILPDHDVVIFDEAHQLESTATEFFGFRVSSGQVEDLARDCRRSVQGAQELGAERVNDCDEHLRPLLACNKAFFSTLRGKVDSPGRQRLEPEEVNSQVEAAYWRLDSALEALTAWIGTLATIDESVKSCGRRGENLRQDLGEILGLQQRTSVYWKEVGPRATAIGASPIDVSGVLRENVFFRLESVVLTSATLTVDQSFAFLRQRLGIDFEAAELMVPSPFDYASQAALYLPSDAPDPRRDGYHEAFTRLLLDTFSVVGGGTMVLFTSHRDMQRVAGMVRREVDCPVSVQGEKPRSMLLHELRTARQPRLLFATASFWEGVDLPGEALVLVVIARLPFASPGDPLVAARLQQLQQEGRKPFIDYQVPLASLALKQGFGRLIRSRRDRGVVAIFDARLQKMGYGKVFLRTLPPCHVVRDRADLSAWWEKARGTPPQ